MENWFKNHPNFSQEYRFKNLSKAREKDRKYYKLNYDKIIRRRKIQSLRYRNAGIISKKLRNYILKKFNYKCQICNYDKNLTIDHIVPVSKKGMTEENNLQVLCRLCNSKKSDIILDKSSIINIRNYSNLCRQSV